MSFVVPLAPRDLEARLRSGDEFLVLDVRESEELAICALPGAVHLPLGELPARLGELDPARPTVCVCHHGIRSAYAAEFLAENGFEALYNLSGGVDRWATEVDPGMRRY